MIDTVAIRKRILELAYQGSLSEQNATDGDVNSLYSDIRKYVANTELSEVDSTEFFTEIPSNWKWVRIGNVAKINPKNVKDDDEDASFIPMTLVVEGFQNKHSFEVKKWGDIKKGFNHFCEGDIGVAKITPCFQNRKSVIFRNLHNGFGACTTELVILRTMEDLLLGEYLLYFFKTEYFILKGVESFTGVVGQQRIHKDYLKMSPIPLPPVEEQRRIVQKIKESFELLDIIDALQVQYSSDLEVLKSKIIDAAIRGKLTEQLPEDGTAEELVKQIAKEKKQLIKEKKIKATKALPEITEDEIPFEIPDTWKWVRLSEIMDVRDGTHDSPKYVEEGVPLVTSKNISSGGLNFSNVNYITQDDADKINERSNVDTGDILFAMIGTIGNPVIVEKDRDFCIKNVALFKNFAKERIDIRYIYWMLMREQYVMKKKAIGGLQPFISLKVFREYPIPLPPIAEQKRISARLDEIISMC